MKTRKWFLAVGVFFFFGITTEPVPKPPGRIEWARET
jgi:hypothetical protein